MYAFSKISGYEKNVTKNNVEFLQQIRFIKKNKIFSGFL
jgi:hypothetical protein